MSDDQIFHLLNRSYYLSMGCVSGKTNEQKPKGQAELKPYIQQQPLSSSKPVESSSHPIPVPEVNHNSNHMQAPSTPQKNQAVHSSLQNQHKNNVNSALPGPVPQVLPPNSNIKVSHHSGIKQEDIKIAAGETSGLVKQDLKHPASAVVEDLVVSNGDKKPSAIIEQNIKEEVVQIQESRKQGVEHFMRQSKEDDEVVLSEGGANFIPVVKGINFQIHIN